LEIKGRYWATEIRVWTLEFTEEKKAAICARLEHSFGNPSDVFDRRPEFKVYALLCFLEENSNRNISSTLKMEAIRSSETSVNKISTRCHIPEDCFLHSHSRENLKSYVILTVYASNWGHFWNLLWSGELFLILCVVDLSTKLQAGRPRVRFPMKSLDFLTDLILPATLWPWSRVSL
jgi:hypothetical protein